ncbi:MAG: EamA-like transporter family protein [Methanomassiliicoccales archaeon PtaU1.Bin124]|nr:MAG: EamA-like transporter family protein [Methanomassiliicoccales archaeon PtaU1.Bin124]
MVKGPILAVLVSGALFGLSVPFSKVLVGDIPAVTLAGLLYAGSFLGLLIWTLIRGGTSPARSSSPLTRYDVPYLAGAVFAGGVLAPILLMVGLQSTAGSSASLLLNLEGVATAVIAVAVFREHGGWRLWTALAAMTGASFIISYSPGGMVLGEGPILIVLAMVCWGIDNNLMQKVSDHDPVQLALIKSAVAASVSLTLGLSLYGGAGASLATAEALAIGMVCYGVSMALFMVGLKYLGSSRTGTFFSVGPYVAAVASIPLLGDHITLQLLVAGGLMAFGTWTITREGHAHEHRHEAVEHEHVHAHDDGEHEHHPDEQGRHSHRHVHPEIVHTHVHWPDSSHSHQHQEGVDAPPVKKM